MTTPTNNPPAPAASQTTVSSTMKEAAALVALSTAAARSEAIAGSHHLVVPAGFAHKDITDLVERVQPAPRRKAGEIRLKSLESLLDVLEDQAANGVGYVYADPDKRTITAVFNDQRGDLAGWRDHRAVFAAEYTPEFETWLRHNKQPKGQTEFAEFIEDNFADITEPAAQQLLDVATTIQAKTDIAFSSAKRLQDGQTQLGYTETIDARAGANRKARGVVAGIPDIVLVRAGRLHGLELKSRAGRLSDAQVAYRDALLAAGGDYVVARTLDDVAFALAGWGVPLRCRLLPFLAADAVRAVRRRRAA